MRFRDPTEPIQCVQRIHPASLTPYGDLRIWFSTGASDDQKSETRVPHRRAANRVGGLVVVGRAGPRRPPRQGRAWAIASSSSGESCCSQVHEAMFLA
jgi:hypothetical protein